MTEFPGSITTFLEDRGFKVELCNTQGSLLLFVRKDGLGHIILPYPINACTAEDAQAQGKTMEKLMETCVQRPVIIPEDLWRRCPQMMQARLLAHLEDFTQIYARNCEIRRIEKPEAAEFLFRTHSYGDAACRYRYGMYLKRHTGHNAESIAQGSKSVEAGTLVAVATFSNARKWKKGDKEIRSYEWTRYASLPGLRINGGMGKLLKAFIKDIAPDDIMSYADLEWSEGDVYRQLGFTLEGHKDPVTFMVDTGTWRRFPVRPGMTGPDGSGMKEPDGSDMNGQDGSGMKEEDRRFFQNFGSNKYRLKLTEYE